MPDTTQPNEDAGGEAAQVPAATPAGHPYQALYRRYRPQRFADVRGQEHVTRALRNAVREERVAHAYLFSGPRGTGKTSTARILAMALNCESPEGGEPDGTCASCLSVRAGASMDVFELDAASNRKLDEMRDLLSRVALGTPGQWKVYIIDEVHQLTADAASALLKTLEEPPSRVVFMLATTDPQKVLPTIVSRTQHFEFHLLDGDMLSGLLTDINTDAGLGLSPHAVELAVERGRGSARDAESALEQLAAAGDSQDDPAPLSELVEALAQRDVSETLQVAARAVATGREPRRLGNDLVDYLRNAFLAHQAPSLVLLPAAGTGKLAEQAQEMGLPFLVRCMETVGQALVEMRDAVDPRVTLEVALIRLAAPAVDASPGALLERVERLERSLADRGAPPPVPARSDPVPVVPRPTPPASRPSAAPPSPASSAPSPASSTPSPASSAPSPDSSAPAPDSSAPAPVSPAPAPAGPAPGGRAALGAFLRGGPGAANASTVTTNGPDTPGAVGAAISGPAEPLPTRDELTKAWGDTVLGKLTRQAQVYMGGGRFVEVSGGAAVFALSDRGMLDRAVNFVPEAETALANHFGLRVPLRLVLDPGAGPQGRSPAATDEVAPAPPEDTYDLDDINEMTSAPEVPMVPVEQRILEAFPGSVLDS